MVHPAPSHAPTIAGRLAEHLRTHFERGLSDAVLTAGRRGLLNIIGTTIGGSHHPATDAVVAMGRAHGHDPSATVPGRAERVSPYHAALAIGVAAHVDDFDDTHLATVIHPGAATFGGAWAAVDDACAATTRFGTQAGRALVEAFTLGCEAQLRVGVAMSPQHYEAGWHITGTCGTVGAAAAAGLLLGLDHDELASALVLAGCAPLGLRDAFGTMTKPFHAGKAAAIGYQAATLAVNGARVDLDLFERPSGFYSLLAGTADTGIVTDDWSGDWEIEANTFKPYPCGIVVHPVIDAGIEAHNRLVATGSLDVGAIESIRVTCHPLVRELTGNPDPTDGLEARFSAIHGLAVGLVHGRASLREYEADAVLDPVISGLRARTRLATDPAIRRDEAGIEIRSLTGEVHTFHVEHATGSLDNPMTDDHLLAKVDGLVSGVIATPPQLLAHAVMTLESSADLAALSDLMRPETTDRNTHG